MFGDDLARSLESAVSNQVGHGHMHDARRSGQRCLLIGRQAHLETIRSCHVRALYVRERPSQTPVTASPDGFPSPAAPRGLETLWRGDQVLRADADKGEAAPRTRSARASGRVGAASREASTLPSVSEPNSVAVEVRVIQSAI